MKSKYLVFLIIFLLYFFKFTTIGKKINNVSDFIVFIFKYYIVVPWINMARKRNTFEHTKSMVEELNIKLIKNNKSSELSEKRTIYLVNHRSWTDFWLDIYLLKGNATYISRKIIKNMMYPACKLYSLENPIIFFKRGDPKAKKKLYQDIINTLNKDKNLILYPEGTRNTSSKSKPLRFGIIKLGYEQKVPFQILIVDNKEKILNEKNLTINKNITSEYYISQIIDPNNFKTLEDFTKEVQKKWIKSWNIIYK